MLSFCGAAVGKETALNTGKEIREDCLCCCQENGLKMWKVVGTA